MTPKQFIDRWKPNVLTERSACQSHFADLCTLLGQPKPTDVDPTGSSYTFEKGVAKEDGRQGWADVWKKGHFGWEYKGKHKDLKGAYKQLQQYRESLENPPLLVVCDLDRFEIHTNFTGFAAKVYAFDLDGLPDAKNLNDLRLAFTDPGRLRPDQTQEAVTEEIAEVFKGLADGLRLRGEDPQRAAHFILRLMFCMFAEKVRLLREGLYTDLVKSTQFRPEKLWPRLQYLFQAVSDGGNFGPDEVSHFKGGQLEGDA